MNEQKQYKRVQVQSLKYGEKSNLPVMVDNRPIAVQQAQMINSIRRINPTESPVIQNNSIVQFNKVLKHEYRNLENPGYTLANYLSSITKVDKDQVFKDMVKKVPDSQYLDRPDRVIAYIDHKTGSALRPSLITEIGHLGNFEERLRGRTLEDYDGGHLLALKFYNNWLKINTSSNVTPQRRNDNQAPGNWYLAESEIDKKNEIVIEAAVNYPDRTYTVWPDSAIKAIRNPSRTYTAYQNLGYKKYLHLPTFIYSWVPSQYHMSVTAVNSKSSPALSNLNAGDFTNWLPVVHRLASPLKGLVTRLIPHLNIYQKRDAKSFFGGIDVRSQGNHPIGDSLNEVKQMVIDLIKLTGVVFTTKQAANVLAMFSKIPDITPFLSKLPVSISGYLSGAPIAALLIYAFSHQLNITRILPEFPGVSQLKYLLGFLGL